jgi:transposase
MKSRLGAPKAITATAHKLAKIVYNMLKYRKAYIDVGAEYYEKRFRQRVLANLTRRAFQFKLRLVPLEE